MRTGTAVPVHIQVREQPASSRNKTCEEKNRKDLSYVAIPTVVSIRNKLHPPTIARLAVSSLPFPHDVAVRAAVHKLCSYVRGATGAVRSMYAK